jgi:hypothetical protein
MIPSLFTDQWEVLDSSPHPLLEKVRPWTESECLRCLRRILSSPFDKMRFFFFIDGLDECDGNYEELVSLLKEMASSAHIKLCLASRPWNIFQDAFDRVPSLTLQQLTTRDISHYVHSEFNAHRGFMELQKGNPKVAARLCDDVTKKASGVFLWVRLAVTIFTSRDFERGPN